jgi:hypothetical protein
MLSGSHIAAVGVSVSSNVAVPGAQVQASDVVPLQSGDYNLDGIVDTADYTVWRDTRGQHVVPFTRADGNGDGIIDSDDYEVWVENFGRGQPHTAPAITSTAPGGSIAVGATFTYYVGASGNPAPSFALDSAPNGMAIDPATGVVTWTPSPGQEGVQTATVSATNALGQGSQSFSLTVVPQVPTGVIAAGASSTSIAVSWNASTDPSITGYNVYERTVYHSPRGSGGGFRYRLLSSNQPETTYVANGLVAGSSHTYVVTALDANLGLTSGYSTAAGSKTWVPPSLQPDYLLPSGAVFSGPIAATVGQTVQIQLLGAGNPPVVYSALDGPQTLTVDPTTGIVTFTPDAADVGTLLITFQAQNVLGAVTQTLEFDVA